VLPQSKRGSTRRGEETERLFEYYEEIKREIKRRPIYEFRYDERLKVKSEGSTHLVYTGLNGGLEHLKMKTRLIDERFTSLMGECVN
jgi:hypothetical protein